MNHRTPYLQTVVATLVILWGAGIQTPGIWAAEPSLDPEKYKDPGAQVEVKSEHFTVIAFNKDLAQLTSDLAEKYLDELCQAMLGGAVFPHKVTLKIYKTKDEYHHGMKKADGSVDKDWPGGNPIWSGGVARHDAKWGKPDKIELYQLDASNHFDPDTVTRTLPHELTHVVIADLATTRGCPIWLNEGLAKSFEKHARPQGELRGLALAIQGGRYVRFKEIMALDDYPQNVQSIQLFYLQSESMARFLLSTLNPAQFNTFLKAAINKEPMDKALASAFGINKQDALDQVENRWAKWIADNYGFNLNKTAPAADMSALFAKVIQRENDLVAGTRAWQRRTFAAPGAVPKDWKIKAGVLTPGKATVEQPALLPLTDLPAGPYLVRFKAKRDASVTVPVRFSAGAGETPPVPVGADLTDDNWHELIVVATDELAFYADGKCTGRTRVNAAPGQAVTSVLSLYGAASIKDVDVANAVLPK